MNSPAKTAGDSSTDQPIFNLGSLLQGSGSNSSTAGQSTFNTGVSSVEPSINYYSKLLSGDPTATAAAIAPTTSGIMQQYDTAFKNITDNSSRGGQRSGNVASNETAKAGAVSNVIDTVQPTAAAALGGLGTSLASAGTNETNAGTSQLIASLQSLLGMRGQDIGYSENQQQSNAGFGTAIGKLLAGFAQ